MLIVMLDVLLYIVAVLVAIAAVIAGLFVLIFLAAKATALFTRERTDKTYGKVTHFAGVSSFETQVGDYRKVRVALPGRKDAFDPKALALFERIKEAWPSLRPAFLEHFSAEIAEGDKHFLPADVPALAAAADKTGLLKYTQMIEINVERAADRNALRGWVGFLHDWDPEHTRSLLIDENLQITDYGLTVGM